MSVQYCTSESIVIARNDFGVFFVATSVSGENHVFAITKNTAKQAIERLKQLVNELEELEKEKN